MCRSSEETMEWLYKKASQAEATVKIISPETTNPAVISDVLWGVEDMLREMKDFIGQELHRPS